MPITVAPVFATGIATRPVPQPSSRIGRTDGREAIRLPERNVTTPDGLRVFPVVIRRVVVPAFVTLHGVQVKVQS